LEIPHPEEQTRARRDEIMLLEAHQRHLNQHSIPSVPVPTTLNFDSPRPGPRPVPQPSSNSRNSQRFTIVGDNIDKNFIKDKTGRQNQHTTSIHVLQKIM